MNPIWLKEYTDEIPSPVKGKFPSLADIIRNSSKTYPDKPAVKADDISLTYKALDRITSVVAGNLRLLGLDLHDKVCIFLPNCVESILAFWGVVRGGFVAVMTNPLYSVDELIHQANDSDSRIIITTSPLLAKVMDAIDKTKIEKVFVIQNGCITEPNDSRIYAWNDLMKENVGYTYSSVDPEREIAVLQYTGGTTGVSKGCMLTHRNLVSNAFAVKYFFSSILKPGEEKVVGVLPYFHIYGLQISVIFSVLMAAEMIPMTRFTPKGLLNSIQNDKVTFVASAPSIFSACLNQKDISSYSLKSLKLMMSGSAPLPKSVKKEFEEKTEAKITEGYGLSEASPITHFTPINGRDVECSIGVPVPWTDVKIVDVEYGVKELDIGEDGEICIKGPQIMKGYYKHPGQTEMVLQDGWLHTGDIGHCDKNGYFYITDRKKDLIISGGYNVYPREIEEVLYKFEPVKEAAVIGIPDKLRGEIAKAFVVLRPGADTNKREIIAYCRGHLANYKVPRIVEIVDALPKSAVGKILKTALRKMS